MLSTVDTIWILVMAVLVFFMQAGFMLVECGFVRAKNAGNIIMKNVSDYVFGIIAFWIIGYGLMYGSGNGWIGTINLFSSDMKSIHGTIPEWSFFLFQAGFCTVAATIVSGAMAERTKYKAYIVISVFVCAIVYPVVGHWVWGNGWLSTLSIAGCTGFHDFAGSSVVHMVGGFTALLGAKLLGPRIGKYSKEGKSKVLPAHNIPLSALGVFILWLGWIGFNAGSCFGISGMEEKVALVAVNTIIASVFSTAATIIFTSYRYQKADITMTLNGTLAGLVAITASSDVVEPWSAAIIGIVAGIVVIAGIEFTDKKLKVDDPVGAFGVHGCCGVWGVIAVGFFSSKTGFFITGRASQLLVQLVGACVIAFWVLFTMSIVMLVLKKTIGLRVTPEEEIIGLDQSEHGIQSVYHDFLLSVDGVTAGTDFQEDADFLEKNFSIELNERPPIYQPDSKTKMTRIMIVCKPEKFDKLKSALNEIGITGMTVTNVMGYGVQRGATDYYRGVEVETVLRPKIQLDIVVSKVSPSLVVETARKVLCTGHIGDGKIFIYDVENVVKVRTGETGYNALQGVSE